EGPFGKNWRISPLVCSHVPLCQGQYGLAKKTSIWRRIARSACSANSLPLSKARCGASGTEVSRAGAGVCNALAWLCHPGLALRAHSATYDRPASPESLDAWSPPSCLLPNDRCGAARWLQPDDRQSPGSQGFYRYFCLVCACGSTADTDPKCWAFA